LTTVITKRCTHAPVEELRTYAIGEFWSAVMSGSNCVSFDIVEWPFIDTRMVSYDSKSSNLERKKVTRWDATISQDGERSQR
jgi:hypothetical protein